MLAFYNSSKNPDLKFSPCPLLIYRSAPPTSTNQNSSSSRLTNLKKQKMKRPLHLSSSSWPTRTAQFTATATWALIMNKGKRHGIFIFLEISLAGKVGSWNEFPEMGGVVAPHKITAPFLIFIFSFRTMTRERWTNITLSLRVEETKLWAQINTNDNLLCEKEMKGNWVWNNPGHKLFHGVTRHKIKS